jgi:hypothetical protein
MVRLIELSLLKRLRCQQCDWRYFSASTFVQTVSFTPPRIVTNPCFFGVAQLLLRFIHSDLYAQNRIFATTLALIGIWEQLVLCDCADRDTAVDDVAHSFTMVC